MMRSLKNKRPKIVYIRGAVRGGTETRSGGVADHWKKPTSGSQLRKARGETDPGKGLIGKRKKEEKK